MGFTRWYHRIGLDIKDQNLDIKDQNLDIKDHDLDIKDQNHDIKDPIGSTLLASFLGLSGCQGPEDVVPPLPPSRDGGEGFFRWFSPK